MQLAAALVAMLAAVPVAAAAAGFEGIRLLRLLALVYWNFYDGFAEMLALHIEMCRKHGCKSAKILDYLLKIEQRVIFSP